MGPSLMNKNKMRGGLVGSVVALCALTGLVLAQQNKIAQSQEKSKQRLEMPRRDTREATAALQTLCNNWMAANKRSERQAKFNSIRKLCGPPNDTAYHVGTCEGSGGSIHITCATNLWDVMWNGMSWCSDLGFMCNSMGGHWAVN